MTHFSFYIEKNDIPDDPSDNEIRVWLFGRSPPKQHVGSVGSSLYDAASRLTIPPSKTAMDFVAIAMAVTAADTFVSRDDAPDRWSRNFEITLPLIDPDRWNSVRGQLENTLRFLSGDTWRFEFIDGGKPPPSREVVRRRLRTYDLSLVDCVALFSGGLDSTLGTLDLLAERRRPLLVSHAPSGDANKQDLVASMLPAKFQRFSFNSYPTWDGVDDDSMRTRSFQFLAAASLVADTMSQYRGGRTIDVFLCENGLIALNPPLTARRIGTHSTRTAHPYYLQNISELLSSVGLPIRIVNPHRHETKGEMLLRHSGIGNISALAAETVSCGKWKRANKQCGRCVPCLIRRASFHAAGLTDGTSYQIQNLADVLKSEKKRDDLISVQSALKRRKNRSASGWVLQSGPLPVDPQERSHLFGVAERGFDELEAFLSSESLAP